MMLPTQHLSDEAVAACADGVLGATANARALRHLAVCAECAQAVAAQREAADALRTAPLPALPSGLLDRLRAVPVTTPLPQVDVALDAHGSAVFPAFRPTPPDPRPMAAASFVPAAPSSHTVRRHLGLGTFTAAVVVAVGTATAGAAVVSLRDHTEPAAPAPAPAAPGQIQPAVASHAGISATFAGVTVH